MRKEPQEITALTAVDQGLHLRGVCAGYGRVTILRDIDLSVRPGEIVALLGPNGAGKTTVMRVASGLLRPSAGSVVLDGQVATSWPPHKRTTSGICLVPEGRGIFPSLTVADNLRLYHSPGADPGLVTHALEVFPALAKRRGQLAGSLSGGEQQMLALARAYVSSPSIVLLDELSMGLAPLVVDKLFGALEQLTAAGVGLLIVEQYVARALEMATRAILLDRGRVSFSGLASDLDEDQVLRTYLGADITPHNPSK